MINTWLYTWPDLDIWYYTNWLYCFLFMILIIKLSFIFNLSCCYCTQCLYARALPFFIQSLGRFWRSWILTSSIGSALFHWSGVRWDRTCCEELESLSFDHRYSCSFIHVIFWFYLSYPIAISFLNSSIIIVLDIYMSYCSDTDL